MCIGPVVSTRLHYTYKRRSLSAFRQGCGTVGLFGFAERGWNSSPHAAVNVIAEVLTVVFVAASVLSSRTKTH